MKVAVVIVSYNSSEHLTKCVSRIKAQSWIPDKIIIVDNNSTDSTTTQTLQHLTDIQAFTLPENLGYGGAINYATAQLKDFDFLATLNPDAFPDPDWLANLMTAAAMYPHYGSFASLTLNAKDRTRIDGAGDVLHFSGIPWRRYHSRFVNETDLTDEPVFSACGGAALYRLSAFRKVGGFDESFFMYVEDIDLGFRLQLAGAPCRFVPEAIAEHIGSATTGTNSDFNVYHGHRNLTAAYLKNMPTPLLILTLPLHIMASLVTIVVLSMRGKPRSICKAKLHALINAPMRLAQRNSSETAVSSGYIWQLLKKWPIR